MTFKGFIFDVDGVLVDSPHERAWGDALRRLMESEWAGLLPETTWSPAAYGTEVYQRRVSGKARAEGARALLAAFGIADPDGTRTKRICDVKQGMIQALIEGGEFTAYADALRFLLAAKRGGALLAAASSSKNANAMLSVVRPEPGGPALVELFDADVCGRDFKPGKPAPGIFLAAAQELGLRPGECVVVEDAISGVQAAKAAGAACIGIARLDNSHDLRAAGADWVVDNLDSITVRATEKGVTLAIT